MNVLGQDCRDRISTYKLNSITKNEVNKQYIDINTNKDFINNYKTAILLSLLHENLLTQYQFDLCMEKLKNNQS